MLLSLLLLCIASCIQYVPIPYSIDPIDISALSFNESFVSKSSNGPFQRIDLPFEFHFYDRILRQVWISPNGFISLKPGVRCYGFYATDDCDLESVEYDAFIAPYLTSLNPSRGGNTTSILYRIEDSRLIVIWNNVPTLNLEYRNSFMVILHADGEVVFCYKDFKWPFASTEFYIHGLIGIRPFLSDSYSTKGSYISSWREQWNSNRMGNYANPSDIDAIYQRLFQPRDYVFDYVELFALAPTEICITPSVVSAHRLIG
ncbi:plexin domain-containing protein 1 precursor [Blastocystis sp. ATCC 50177/Nand II]|uniref:Plexin domain-containing protein 1 n=1 Tax=Blastocystis sp. subtype 1 (strain ATCC 50177 / NandII) TaxID=478820 RepID=A0A196S6B4_BLAHN|nr:plexin domain-containing protein 1 precursor [Blastocystis sp. ATCC 50177/Nand II]